MEFEIPETLDGLDLDALTRLESEAVAEFDTTRDSPDLGADGLARLRELAAFVTQVRRRQRDLTQTTSELDDLAGQVHGDDAAVDSGPTRR